MAMIEKFGAYKVSGVYKITSKVHPERCYIGRSVVIWFRWNEHKRLLRRNEHESPILQNHYNKYGLDDLEFSILEICLPVFLETIEQYYIDHDIFKGYFNVCKVAGNCTGVKQSEETRQKRRLANLGKKRGPCTEEHKLHMSQSRKGRPNFFKGKKTGRASWCKGKTGVFSEEALAKMRKSRPHAKENIKKSWIKRKQEGKVGERDEFGKFKKQDKAVI